ncbi:hypothetical protein H0H93_007964, partial [Arthromyces matolae]
SQHENPSTMPKDCATVDPTELRVSASFLPLPPSREPLSHPLHQGKKVRDQRRGNARTKIKNCYAALKDPKEQERVRAQLIVWWEAHKLKLPETFAHNQGILKTKRSEWSAITPPLDLEEIEILAIGLEKDMMERDGLSPQAHTGKMRMARPKTPDDANTTPTKAAGSKRQRSESKGPESIRKYTGKLLRASGKFGHLRDTKFQELVRKKVDQWRAAQDSKAFDENQKELDDKEVEWKKAGIKEDDIKVLRLGYEEIMMDKDGDLFGLEFRRYTSRNKMQAGDATARKGSEPRDKEALMEAIPPAAAGGKDSEMKVVTEDHGEPQKNLKDNICWDDWVVE